MEIAAVIYEHENDGIRAAVGLAAQATPTNLQPVASASSVSLDPPSAPKTGLAQGFVPPGELVKKIFNSGTSHGVDNALNTMGDERIREFAASFGLDFEPVSELNSTSSQFCGLFWDPKSNWIVVAFKGTGPIEFGEWLTCVSQSMCSLMIVLTLEIVQRLYDYSRRLWKLSPWVQPLPQRLQRTHIPS